MWFFKWEFLKNADPHTSQENGLSPVCVRMWLFKRQLLKNPDPQTSQKNVFFPLCVCMCFFSLELSENADPHTLQGNACSLLSASISVFNHKLYENTVLYSGETWVSLEPIILVVFFTVNMQIHTAGIYFSFGKCFNVPF